MSPACLSRVLAMPALALLLSTTAICAQEGEPMRAPLPPQRPFDLDLEGTPKLPPIVVPPPTPRASAPDTPVPASSQETPAATPTPETPAAEATTETPAEAGSEQES